MTLNIWTLALVITLPDCDTMLSWRRHRLGLAYLFVVSYLTSAGPNH